MSAATRAGTESNVDWVKYDITAPRNSQITLKFDYSMRIRTCGGVESNQKVKVSERVPTPLSYNPQNLAAAILHGGGIWRMVRAQYRKLE
jgi:hypothetical protein